MIEVVPAIIAKNFEDLESQINLVSPFIKTVQVDVMDGLYTPEASWPYTDGKIENIKFPENIEVRVDMMVKNPENHIDTFINAGAKTLIIHIESTDSLENIIEKARYSNVGIGVAIRPETENESLYPYISKIDFVQFMGNDKIGFHGVELDEKVLGKIGDLRAMYPELIIGVDIGVNFETANKIVQAGANKLVSGSAIFNSGNIEEAIEKLKNIK